MHGYSISFEAIGTRWQINSEEELSPADSKDLTRSIMERIDDFDSAYSRFRPDSWVRTLSLEPGKFLLPKDGYKLFSFYDTMYRATKGQLTPLIGSVMNDAGYDPDYSLVAKPLTAPIAWDDALSFDHTHVTTFRPLQLDFGAAGKGYLVDLLSDLLENSAVNSYVIDAGGDLIHRGKKEIEVGLENPFDVTQVIGTVKIKNKSLCASSGSKRKWGSFTHIINPLTLHSPSDVQATWVIADDTMTADGIATALFFVEPEELRPQFQFSHARVYEDESLSWDKEFKAQFFQEAAT